MLLCVFLLWQLICFDFQTGTLTEGKPVVMAVSSLAYKESEILRLAAAVEKTTSHPIAKAIINKAELLNLELPSTRGQLTEPGFGTLAEIDGCLVAVGTMNWVHERFQNKASHSDLMDLENRIACLSSTVTSSDHSTSIVFVGREGEGIIGAIAISDILRHDAKSTVDRYIFLIINPYGHISIDALFEHELLSMFGLFNHAGFFFVPWLFSV